MRRLYVFLLLILFFLLLPAYTFGDTVYTVKKGDSLYKISKKFGVSIRDLKTENNIKSQRIKPGIKLHIHKKVQKETPNPVENRNSVNRENRTEASVKIEEGTDKFYIVKKGDTLQKIAKSNSISLREIKKLNGLKTTKIKPGQRLIVSRLNFDDKAQKPEATISATLSEKEQKSDELYIVKKGDTLSSISRKYSVSIDELKENNRLRSTRLRPGQQLIIKSIHPKTYEVKKGDNLFRISKRFNIGINELKEINSLETNALRTGQIILLEPEKRIEKAIIPDKETNTEIKKVSISENISNMGVREKLILFAKKMMDIPYRFGGNSFFGIDCSGFVQKVYSMIGINLPRSARQQFEEGKPIEIADLSIGDLVFFRTYAPFPSHVGIYLGDDLFIHASSIKKKVTIDSLTTPFYLKRFIGAKRVIGIEGEEGG